jgi:hypothetical protein
MGGEVTVSGTDEESILESTVESRARMLEYLRKQWVGPQDGDDERLDRSPVYAYLVGTLYPIEDDVRASPEVLFRPELEALDEALDDSEDEHLDPTASDFDDDRGLNITGAFGWAPQSLGTSFMHDGKGLSVTVRAGIYEPLLTGTTAEGRRTSGSSWQRRQLAAGDIKVPVGGEGSLPVLDGRATLSWRNRAIGSQTLTTVALSNAATCEPGRSKSDPGLCLFQVQIVCEVSAGSLQPYPANNPLNTSEEDLELELRFRNRSIFAIGHGVAVSWDGAESPTLVTTDAIPAQEVRPVRAVESKAEYLSLAWLADEGRTALELASGLKSFVADYQSWIGHQRLLSKNLDPVFSSASSSILRKLNVAQERMREGVETLARGGHSLTAFRLANRAMRAQMQRARPGGLEPRWHPFQLGFILTSLASTVDDSHSDRELVDLIWFPTGGGKTEAYLGLAAIEMIRRRLVLGSRGGGTAVVTRYTMRLLTAQQFQRAATLICALELLRRTDSRLAGSPAFTIGLWIGNTTTPGTFKQAVDLRKQLLRDADAENKFQLRECPWCGTSITPMRRSADESKYGIRATTASFEFFCPSSACEFHELLPVQVVDEAVFDRPPTMLVATVDKFATLAWSERGGSLFGIGTSYAPPTLIIQDELHLITGPLGTIVGVYEAALRALMSLEGRSPKVVASTATTRAAGEQIKELMASRVAVFPASGLDADQNYFSEPDDEAPGRLYVGIMPQAHTPSWAVGQLAGDMLQAPISLRLAGPALDAYWTLVVYHNSLRELGRTMTILRDDVGTALNRKRLVSEEPVRQLSSNGIEELNGKVTANELLRILDNLSNGPHSENKTVLDALAATNILSVGIDVSRLGLMLVNGHPKSTSEYIQATSRVGRGSTPGLVVTMFRSGKPRDRSVFESFGAFHRSAYRYVEPSSVTPWALQARRRALKAAFVILMRHGGLLSGNSDALRFDASSAFTKSAADALIRHTSIADPRETAAVRLELERAIAEWGRRAADAREIGAPLKFKAAVPAERLLKGFTEQGAGWPTMNSMRSVDRVVRIKAEGER